MRLIDMVSSSDVSIGVEHSGRTFYFPGPASFADEIAHCPLRYILDDTVRDATQTLIDQWPDLLQPVDRNFRVPAESLWIEWQDTVNGVEKPQRFGLFIKADKTGRTGHIRSFWENQYGVDVSQVNLYFDLDGDSSLEDTWTYALSSLKPYTLPLDDHIWVIPDIEWVKYFTIDSPNPINEIKTCADTVWRDAYRLFAFSRILTSRIELVQRPIDRSRLNATRRKSKKKPLLDHIELSMDLGRVSLSQSKGLGSRSRSRLHVVRGHLVRRGDRIFWRSTHLRGDDGESSPLKRTVRLK